MPKGTILNVSFVVQAVEHEYMKNEKSSHNGDDGDTMIYSRKDEILRILKNVKLIQD